MCKVYGARPPGQQRVHEQGTLPALLASDRGRCLTGRDPLSGHTQHTAGKKVKFIIVFRGTWLPSQEVEALVELELQAPGDFVH